MYHDELQGQYAGFVSRLVAMVIDIFVITVSLVFITSVANMVTDFASAFIIKADDIKNGIQILEAGLSVIFPIFYLSFFWMLNGQTPGKALMGLQIVRTNGKHIGLGNVLRRLPGYIVSTSVFFLGFFWVLIDNKRQGFHDKLANTIVIYSGPFRLHRDLVSELSRQAKRYRNASQQLKQK